MAGDVTEQLRICRWSRHPGDCPAAQHSPLPAWEHGWLTACKKASAKNHLWAGKRREQHSSVPSLPQQASTPSAGVNEPRPCNAAGDFWSCSAIDTIYVSELAVCSFFHSDFKLTSLQVSWWSHQEIMANLHLAGG